MSKAQEGRAKPLRGWRVLVPRGGPWGHGIAAELRAAGATPVVAPMIDFAATDDPDALAHALADLAKGAFDWLTLASATTVDVLASQHAVIPDATRVAAVGETTAAALKAVGYRFDLVPSEDNTAHGLLEEWETATGGVIPLRVLTLRSEVAKPLLTEGLRRIGHDVQSVVAYRTIGVPVADEVKRDVTSGTINAILVTSGSVAEQVQAQLGPIPDGVVIAAVGPRTAKDARSAGLRVDVTADEQTADSLLTSLTASAGPTE